MYAIIETGGKQVYVKEGSKIFVSKIDAEVGTEVLFDKIFMIGSSSSQVGTPYVKNAKVTATVLEHGRDKKILVFKKWRRNDSRKLQGHRQDYTALKVTAIQL